MKAIVIAAVAGVALLVAGVVAVLSGPTLDIGRLVPVAGDDSDVPVIESEACSEVRAGIDAFNLGRFDETVGHFEKAVPLAEARDDGSTESAQLIEAVRWYADLHAEEYPEAARSSADFQRYQAITLGQCVAGLDEQPQESESPGVPA